MPLPRRLIAGLFPLLLLAMFWVLPADADSAEQAPSSIVQKLDTVDPDEVSSLEEAKSLLRELKNLAQKEESVPAPFYESAP